MSVSDEILFLVILFIANSIQAITGFAGTLLAMPPSILLIGPDRAKVILNIMAFLASGMLVIQNYSYIDKRELAKIVIGMSVGMLIGIWLYQIMSLSFLLPLYGCAIVLIAVRNLFFKEINNISREGLYAILLGAGIMHGMFVSGGALLVIYAAVKFENKHVFRATLASVWTILNIFLMGNDYIHGLYDTEILILTLISIIPLVLATYLGNRIHERINQRIFMKISYGLLALSGLLLLI